MKKNMMALSVLMVLSAAAHADTKGDAKDIQIKVEGNVVAPSCELLSSDGLVVKLRDIKTEELKGDNYVQLGEEDIGGKQMVSVSCSSSAADGKAYFSMNASESDVCMVGTNPFTCSDEVNKTVGIAPKFATADRTGFHFYNNAADRLEVISLPLKDNKGELWITGARVGKVKNTLPMPGNISGDFTVRVWSD
ncbi:hypothetical protein [Aeromonas veronii]|uniref:fimbrial protein n=1 Tax=Aeromonas veronii TaxID=654 RepID=UPI0031FD7BC6